MKNIEIQSNLVKIIDEKKQYIFDCISLAEYIFADITGKYLTIIVTIASGQYGIIAVVDINSDEVIHIQEGSFAISTMVADKKVISFHDVVTYGHYPYYTIEVMGFGNMNIDAQPQSIKVDCEKDFYNGCDSISLSVEGAILKISNGKITHTENMSGLI